MKRFALVAHPRADDALSVRARRFRSERQLVSSIDTHNSNVQLGITFSFQRRVGHRLRRAKRQRARVQDIVKLRHVLGGAPTRSPDVLSFLTHHPW